MLLLTGDCMMIVCLDCEV